MTINTDNANVILCKFLNLRFDPINSLEASSLGGLFVLILCGTTISELNIAQPVNLDCL